MLPFAKVRSSRGLAANTPANAARDQPLRAMAHSGSRRLLGEVAILGAHPLLGKTSDDKD